MLTTISMKKQFNIVECMMSICCRFMMLDTLPTCDIEIGPALLTLAYGVDSQQKIYIVLRGGEIKGANKTFFQYDCIEC